MTPSAAVRPSRLPPLRMAAGSPVVEVLGRLWLVEAPLGSGSSAAVFQARCLGDPSAPPAAVKEFLPPASAPLVLGSPGGGRGGGGYAGYGFRKERAALEELRGHRNIGERLLGAQPGAWGAGRGRVPSAGAARRGERASVRGGGVSKPGSTGVGGGDLALDPYQSPRPRPGEKALLGGQRVLQIADKKGSPGYWQSEHVASKAAALYTLTWKEAPQTIMGRLIDMHRIGL